MSIVLCSSLQPVTNTPPITTVFTPPDSCTTRFHVGPASPSQDVYDFAWNDNQDPKWYKCQPQEYDVGACQGLTFSPGLCPHDWVTHNVREVGSQTMATCCMSDFSTVLADPGNFIACKRDVTNQEVVQLGVTGETPIPENTITMETGRLDHRGWVIMWEEKDLSLFAPDSPRPTNSIGSAGDDEIQDPSAPSDADNGASTRDDGQPGTERSSISTGAIAGVVIGVVALIGIMVGVGVMFWRKRKASGRPTAPYLHPGELPSHNHPPSELSAAKTSELQAGNVETVELPSGDSEPWSGNGRSPWPANGRSAYTGGGPARQPAAELPIERY